MQQSKCTAVSTAMAALPICMRRVNECRCERRGDRRSVPSSVRQQADHQHSTGQQPWQQQRDGRQKGEADGTDQPNVHRQASYITAPYRRTRQCCAPLAALLCSSSSPAAVDRALTFVPRPVLLIATSRIPPERNEQCRSVVSSSRAPTVAAKLRGADRVLGGLAALVILRFHFIVSFPSAFPPLLSSFSPPR